MNKSSIVFLLLILITLVAISIGWFLGSPFVSNNARIAAVKALQNYLGRFPKNGTLIIVDFSQPSQTKRLSVVDLQIEKIIFNGRVAHGKNSGEAYALKLSNALGSQQSSAGLFSVAERFAGKHGSSFRLIGLNPHLNGNAEKRGIIIHSADYVSLKSIIANWKEKFRLGRSDGCFVLSNDDFHILNETLIRPAYLYSYPYDGGLG